MKNSWCIHRAVLVLSLCPLLVLCIGFWPLTWPADWWSLVCFTAFLALAGTFLAFVLSLPLIFCAARYNRLALILMATALIPLFLPPSIASVLFFHTFDAVYRIFDIEGRGNFGGILFAHAFYEVPIFIFYLGLALRQIPPGYHDMMLCDGIGKAKKILFLLSMIKGPILQAAAIVYIYIFQSTVLVISLGMGRYETLESRMLLLAGKHGNFSQVLLLALLQFFVLFSFYFFTKFSGQKNSPYVQLSKKSDQILRTHIFFDIYAIFYLVILVVWFLPLIIHAIPGLRALGILWQEYRVIQSIMNSLSLSLLASLFSVILAYFWISSHGKKWLVCLLFISQTAYFSGVLFLGVLFDISRFVMGLWALMISLWPYIYFFLMSTHKTQDQQIMYAARLDGGRGWQLYINIYWPIWRERWLGAFWSAFILAFGNYSFSYLIASSRFPLASATLVELMERRHFAAANAFALILIVLLIVPLVVLSAKRATKGHLPT
ncbi:MAG: hypothetical protein ACRCVN_01645 [Spirochaetia bacterium]